MLSTWRYTTFGLSCLLAAAAVAADGSASRSFAQEPADASAKAEISSKNRATGAAEAKIKSPDGKRQLNDPLLKRFGELLDKADDLESSDKNTAVKILQEADPLLTRIRQENRRAIERANRPVRLHGLRSKRLAPIPQKATSETKKVTPETKKVNPEIKRVDPEAKKAGTPTPAEKAKGS